MLQVRSTRAPAYSSALHSSALYEGGQSRCQATSDATHLTPHAGAAWMPSSPYLPTHPNPCSAPGELIRLTRLARWLELIAHLPTDAQKVGRTTTKRPARQERVPSISGNRITTNYRTSPCASPATSDQHTRPCSPFLPYEPLDFVFQRLFAVPPYHQPPADQRTPTPTCPTYSLTRRMLVR